MNGNKSSTGYCGLYYGACGIRQGKVKGAVENLRKVIEAYGFDRTMPEPAKWEPSMWHYAEFDRVTGGLVKLFGECLACFASGGDPTCVIRQCCQPKGYVSCAECNEMETCEKVQNSPAAKKRLQEIKALGINMWVEEMERKVSIGYCYLDEKT